MPLVLLICAAFCVAMGVWAAAWAATVQGTVVNSDGLPVASARVFLRTVRGTEQSATTDPRGQFLFREIFTGEFRLVVLARGYRSYAVSLTVTAADELQEIRVRLETGGISEEIVVTASSLDLPLSQTPSAVAILDRKELEQMQIQSVSDALRYVPGIQVNQTGRRGAVTAVFARGGESDFNLVLVDGVQINEFGGNYDFSTLPADAIDRVEIVRGPQSALYGSDAISSVINIITKKGTSSPTADFLAEGGSFATRRFAVGGQGSIRGWRLALNASRLDTDGIRINDDYRNQNISLNVEHDLGPNHQLGFQFLGNNSQVGSPGPFGSDPLKVFGGAGTTAILWRTSMLLRSVGC